MKKLFVIALAAVLVVMFNVPATAKVTHKFNGYWRTRWYSYDNLDYMENSSSLNAVDTRTRLKYTAVLHENLKLINYFEMDAVWGKNPKDSSYGDRGADAVALEIKNTYADFNFANLQWQIGTQNFRDATGGFVYNDDMTGMKINYRADNYVASLRWVRWYEGFGTTQFGGEGNGVDYDMFDFIFNYKMGNHRIAPFITYMKTNDGSGFDGTAGEPQDLYFLGLRYDLKFGNYKWYVNAIYEGGSVDDNTDVTAYVFDTNLSGKWGQWSGFLRFSYVSGDDDTTDNDEEGWYLPSGKIGSVSNLSELWGDGKFDVTKPEGSPGKEPRNWMHIGIGGAYKLSKAWNFKLAYWYLNAAQDGPTSEDALTDTNIGSEFDFWATWTIMKSLKLDMLFSYLIAGDAIEGQMPAGVSTEDPWELGAQLSLKF